MRCNLTFILRPYWLYFISLSLWTVAACMWSVFVFILHIHSIWSVYMVKFVWLGMALLWFVNGHGRHLSCYLVSSCLNSGLYNLLLSLARFEHMKETKHLLCVFVCRCIPQICTLYRLYLWVGPRLVFHWRAPPTSTDIICEHLFLDEIVIVTIMLFWAIYLSVLLIPFIHVAFKNALFNGIVHDSCRHAF